MIQRQRVSRNCLLSLSVCLPATLGILADPSRGDDVTVIFGTAPGIVGSKSSGTHDSNITISGGPDMGKEAYAFDDNFDGTIDVGVPQFNPAWGNLTSVNVATSPDAAGIVLLHAGPNGSAFELAEIHAIVTGEPIGDSSDFFNDIVVLHEPDEPDDSNTAEAGHDLFNVIPGASGESSGGPLSFNPSLTNFVGTGTYVFTLQVKVDNAGNITDVADTVSHSLDPNACMTIAWAAGSSVAVTYNFNTSMASGGGNGSGSGSGGIWILPTPPSDDCLTIPTNFTQTISNGTLSRECIDVYGELDQTGGNLTLSDDLNLIDNYETVGNATVERGTYNICGGNATLGSLIGDGTANITGGSLTITSVDHTGIINQSAGSLSASNFTQTGTAFSNGRIGGVYNLSSNGTASLGIVTNNGIINQSGGNLTATSFAQTDSTVLLPDISNITITTTHFGVFNQTGGTSSLGNVTGNGTIIIGANATMTAASLSMPSGSLTVNGNATVLSTAAARQDTGVIINIGNLTIGSTGILDVTNHDLIIGNTTRNDVQAEILNGFGVGLGGAEITSSTAITDGNKFLVPIDATAYAITSWDNVAITEPDSVIVKYTYFGDLNLDGQVDAGDDAVVDMFFGPPAGPGGDIITGDADLSGVVDAGDYAFIDNYLGDGVGNPLIATPANTPEPASLCLLGSGALALLSRRRRK